MSTQDEQVKSNYEVFKKLLPELLKTRPGKHALLRDGDLIAAYDTLTDAIATAEKLFPDGRWSIQQVTMKPYDLGMRSRAVSIG